jgi:hypothetical protein
LFDFEIQERKTMTTEALFHQWLNGNRQKVLDSIRDDWRATLSLCVMLAAYEPFELCRLETFISYKEDNEHS